MKTMLSSKTDSATVAELMSLIKKRCRWKESCCNASLHAILAPWDFNMNVAHHASSVQACCHASNTSILRMLYLSYACVCNINKSVSAMSALQ